MYVRNILCQFIYNGGLVIVVNKDIDTDS